MSSFLIITVGSRDVQLHLSHEHFSINEGEDIFPIDYPEKQIHGRRVKPEGNYFTICPRPGGSFLLENFDIFEPIVEFPIIHPVLKHIKNKGINPTLIMLIYTDQEKEYQEGKVQLSHFNNDTIHFAEIVEKLLKKEFPTSTLDEFGVFRQLTDLGAQYDQFGKIKTQLITDEEPETVYLLPQGGIDAINQALILRLIETYKEKVILLQKPEDQEVAELDFVGRFISTLNKQKILQALRLYQFRSIDKNLTTNKEILALCDYCEKRLARRYNEINWSNPHLLKFKNAKRVTSEFEKLQDLYLSAKISFLNKNYNEFIWQLITLNELYFEHLIKQEIPEVNKYNVFINSEKWLDFWNDYDHRILDNISNNGRWIEVNKPNRRLNYEIFIQLVDLDHILDVKPQFLRHIKLTQKIIERLNRKRNEIAHELGNVSLNTINNHIKAVNTNLDSHSFLNILDDIFEIDNEYGIFKNLMEEILELVENE